jgi:hypothetical protein
MAVLQACCLFVLAGQKEKLATSLGNVTGRVICLEQVSLRALHSGPTPVHFIIKFLFLNNPHAPFLGEG